jgi:endonuclease/exonuclease/phosphatase family metal-dependent hydrolase
MFLGYVFISLFSFSFLFECAQPLRLVQYNAEWLFYDYYAPADCPGAGCTWHNATAAQTHIDTIAARLQTLQPDIVNVCEVEGLTELQMLNYTAAAAYLVKGTDSATGQNVGLLSKLAPLTGLARVSNTQYYPIENSTCGYEGAKGSTGVSKHYYTIIDDATEGGIGPFALVGVHLLAYPTDPTRCAEREAQATIVQELIWNLTNAGHEIVVMGDFNDYDGQVADAQNDVPLSSVLEIVKGLRGPRTYATGALVSAATKLAQEDRWSDWWDKNDDCKGTYNEMTMIDHVLLSPALYDRITSVEIWHHYDEYCGKWDSDHYPVVVDLQ